MASLVWWCLEVWGRITPTLHPWNSTARRLGSGTPFLLSGTPFLLWRTPLLFSGTKLLLSCILFLFFSTHFLLSDTPLHFSGTLFLHSGKNSVFSGTLFLFFSTHILLSDTPSFLRYTPSFIRYTIPPLRYTPPFLSYIFLLSDSHFFLSGTPLLFSGTHFLLSGTPLLSSSTLFFLWGTHFLLSGSPYFSQALHTIYTLRYTLLLLRLHTIPILRSPFQQRIVNNCSPYCISNVIQGQCKEHLQTHCLDEDGKMSSVQDMIKDLTELQTGWDMDWEKCGWWIVNILEMKWGRCM